LLRPSPGPEASSPKVFLLSGQQPWWLRLKSIVCSRRKRCLLLEERICRTSCYSTTCRQTCFGSASVGETSKLLMWCLRRPVVSHWKPLGPSRPLGLTESSLACRHMPPLGLTSHSTGNEWETRGAGAPAICLDAHQPVRRPSAGSASFSAQPAGELGVSSHWAFQRTLSAAFLS